MKNIVISLFDFISRLNLGAFYPVMIPSVIIAVFAITFIIGIFCYRVRKTDKTILLAATLSVYTLSVIKAVCDLISKPLKENFVLSCAGGLFMSALSFAFYGLLCLQYNCRSKLSGKEKRLIARLSRSDDDKTEGFPLEPEEPRIIKTAFSETPFKKAEFLPTEKYGYPDKAQTDNPNFGEILLYAQKLERHDLTDEEKAVIGDLKTRIESYSRKTISCEERKALSLKLMKLLKLISKYRVS